MLAHICASCAPVEGEALDPSFIDVLEMIEFEAVEASCEVHQFSLSGQGVMMVFCNECGSQVAEGSKFCLGCGTRLPTVQTATPPRANAAPPPTPSAALPAPDAEQHKKKGGAAFFSSPVGIALVVILAIAVIGGLTVGIIFLVKGGSNNTADAETLRVWDEYKSIAESDSSDFATINLDQAGLIKSQEDLKKSQERLAALKKTLENTGGTTARQQGTGKSTNARDIKADQMAAALDAYTTYLTKLYELFATLKIANLLDPSIVNTINAELQGLQTLSAKVKTLSNDFLANNTKVAAGTFDPAILATPKALAAEVQKNVTSAQTAEQQRLAAEKAAADQQAAAAAAAAAAAQPQQQQQQQQQQRTTMASCPQCGASDPSVWMQTRSGYHCLNCGYIWHDPNAQ